MTHLSDRIDPENMALPADPAGPSAEAKCLRELSIVLCQFLGGGSEWFKRIGDEYYVDPQIVGPELQRRKTDAHITKSALIRANRARQECAPTPGVSHD